jgi:Predicted redox protein, regulator of disulfide bond formation
MKIVKGNIKNGENKDSIMAATLDAKGLTCPMPLVKTRGALSRIDLGETLTVFVTDPTSYIDISLFCDTTGQDLISVEERDEVYVYTIRKTTLF